MLSGLPNNNIDSEEKFDGNYQRKILHISHINSKILVMNLQVQEQLI